MWGGTVGFGSDENTMDENDRQHSSEAQSIDDEGIRSNKRKSDDGSSPHIRAKRNRYVSVACNECKRRKIKCNGQVPCQRCGRLCLECLYAPNCCSSGFKDSEEFRAMNATIRSLQEQVDKLYSNLSALHSSQESKGFLRQGPPYPHPPSSQPSYQSSILPRGKHPRFQGPTSSAFNFDVANSSLQTMGITEVDVPDERELNSEENSLVSSSRNQPAIAPMVVPPPEDSIWKIPKDEAIRLCRVYEEEIGITCPMFDIETCISQASRLSSFPERTARAGLLIQGLSGSNNVTTDDINILKLIYANTLTVEGCGLSELGAMLFESVRNSSQNQLWEPVDSKGLILLVLVALYFFHLDDEIQAYRFIGLAARLSLEMGMHRREIITKLYPDDDDFCWALKIFWSIYVLDRRWSFGTGMPFAIQDADIDPTLPEPECSPPYLTAMISYSRISSKVWCSVSNIEGSRSEIKKDNIGYLDYQILEWQKGTPESLRFYPSNSAELFNRGQRRLQLLIYLRTNQLRILIYRPVLHSATSIMENRHYAQKVVGIAKDTIRVLSRINSTSDIYRTQQACFNYFLVSALAVLFLAVSHTPIEFNRQVRDEFYMALDLIKGFSTKSYISKRLWITIKGLKEVAPKLGLVSRPSHSDIIDPHSSAAVAMAGLAGHPVDQVEMFSTNQGPNSLGNSPMNGHQLSYELTNLFEAAGGYGSGSGSGCGVNSTAQGIDSVSGYVGTQGEINQVGEGFSGIYGNDGEFSRIMRDLF